jgi:3-methylcrotonyl-CoA carboxylase beta subunit
VAPALQTPLQQAANLKVNKGLAKELSARLAATRPGIEDPSVKRHVERGKLPVWDRVGALLDLGSPVLEIASLAGLDLYEGVRPGGGIVSCVGLVHGKPVMVIANDATVKGGTYFPITVKKHLRAQEIAKNFRLPCVYLVDSGGAFLPMQSDVFPDRDHFGRIFFNQARLSSDGIPQISVVLGSCTAGGAYVPAMSDQTIMVSNQATIFLGGPPLVKAATGEEVSAEELGGADVHTAVSGVADYIADCDASALAQARELLRFTGQCGGSFAPIEAVAPPHRSAQELYRLIPSDPKQYFPMQEVLECLVDGSAMDLFKPRYGSTLVCGFAALGGHTVGILANDGILFSESALKGAHFIQLCEQRGVPLLFFQNIVGFMVGKEYEHRGIAKDGAKLVNAVACASVPKFTVVVGNSYGAGNYGMCGRAYDPHLLFSWPNAKTAVMGPKQAAEVLTQVRGESFAARKIPWGKNQSSEYFRETEEAYEKEAAVWFGSSRMWDDGVIDPVSTREILSFALSILPQRSSQERPRGRYGTFRM